MKNTSRLTEGYKPDLAQQIRQTVPGMAHFSGTGPPGATCGKCVHLGYERRASNGKTKHFGGCAKFCALTAGKHSPKPIPPSTLACRHFERRADRK